jgi:hypothetical protein|tara:strand:- start:4 stop:255 length:252 start_codon:yes stop_codon:yes gene_type:complete
MISDRCRGRNLLNHCKQVSNPKNLEIKYNKITNRGVTWECSISYNNNNDELINNKYSGVSKMDALSGVIDKIECDLKVLVGVK